MEIPNFIFERLDPLFLVLDDDLELFDRVAL